MDSFEYNKIAAAVLIALLAGSVASQIGKRLINPDITDPKALPVPTQENHPCPPASQDTPLKDIQPFLIKAQPEKGEKIFKKCSVCHNLHKGQPHKIGPSLWNIVLSPMAKAVDYAYSAALKAKTENWTYENLNKFLYNPRQFAPGTKMTFVGIANDQDRADLIVFLRQHADHPASLP